MRRLHISIGAVVAAAVAVVLTAAAPSASADNTGNQGGTRDDIFDEDRAEFRLDFIPLRLGAFETASAHRVVMVIGDQLYGTELAGRVIRRSENRIGLDGVPLLGEITRFSYSRALFTPQAFAGSAGLVGDALILNIDVAADAKPWLSPGAAAQLGAVLSGPPLVQAPAQGQLTIQTVVTLNDDYSFVIAGSQIRPLQVPAGTGDTGRVPLLGDIPIVGRLFTATNTDNNSRELLILISPSIVE